MGATCSGCANSSSVALDQSRELPEEGEQGDKTTDEARELAEFEPNFKREVCVIVTCSVIRASALVGFSWHALDLDSET